MKPETAAAIARRIGIIAEPVDGGVFMREANALYGHTMTVEGLATYLATGDRPLRVWSALARDYHMSLVTDETDGSTVVGLDYLTRTGQLYGTGDTPAAAIINCAAALEEGQ